MTLRFFDQYALAFAVVLGLAMVLPEAPTWTVIFTLALLLLRGYFDWRSLPSWSGKITIGLGFLVFAHTYINQDTIFGQEAAAALLPCLAALKIMDFKNERDKKFVILLAFIILSLKPLFTLDFYWLIPSLIGFFALWRTLLLGENQAPWRFLLRVFGMSLPLTAFLFFLFPRFVLPWATERASPQGQVGFSENLNPGEIAEIAIVDELAFRAVFSQASKFKSSELYWRGAVLTNALGLSWTPENTQAVGNLALPTAQEAVEYQIVLEPSESKRIFTLEYPLALVPPLRRDARLGTFRLPQNPRSRFSYSGRSAFKMTNTDLPVEQEKFIPPLPEKTKAWIDSVLKSKRSSSDRLKEVESFFSTGKFKYTLRPGTYKKDPDGLDDFLFLRRTGFCEHFAGSYATLVRALGIPSRVVVGYQGGRYNPFGNFWQISSRDAHAWVEVYIGGTWTRMDPTAWAAPGRLQLGAFDYFNQSPSNVGGFFTASARLATQFGINQVWTSTVGFVENLNFLWVNFMIQFSQDGKNQNWLRSNIFIYVTTFAIVAFVVVSLFRSRPENGRKISKIQKEFFSIEKRLRARGILRQINEAPLSFLNRAISQDQEASLWVLPFAKKFESERYKGPTLN